MHEDCGRKEAQHVVKEVDEHFLYGNEPPCMLLSVEVQSIHCERWLHHYMLQLFVIALYLPDWRWLL